MRITRMLTPKTRAQRAAGRHLRPHDLEGEEEQVGRQPGDLRHVEDLGNGAHDGQVEHVEEGAHGEAGVAEGQDETAPFLPPDR